MERNQSASATSAGRAPGGEGTPRAGAAAGGRGAGRGRGRGGVTEYRGDLRGEWGDSSGRGRGRGRGRGPREEAESGSGSMWSALESLTGLNTVSFSQSYCVTEATVRASFADNFFILLDWVLLSYCPDSPRCHAPCFRVQANNKHRVEDAGRSNKASRIVT